MTPEKSAELFAATSVRLVSIYDRPMPRRRRRVEFIRQAQINAAFADGVLAGVGKALAEPKSPARESDREVVIPGIPAPGWLDGLTAPVPKVDATAPERDQFGRFKPKRRR